MGALSARLSLRPHNFEGHVDAPLGRIRAARMRRRISPPSLRGAFATKQSRLSPRKDSGLLRFARNDGAGGCLKIESDVGWAKRQRAHRCEIEPVGGWWARRLRAFAHPTAVESSSRPRPRDLGLL